MRDFAKLIWQLASPQWQFDDATFERSAAAFDNPDHAGIVVHNYRWRLGLAEGEPRYDAFERRLGEFPTIFVPGLRTGGASTATKPIRERPLRASMTFLGAQVGLLVSVALAFSVPVLG